MAAGKATIKVPVNFEDEEESCFLANFTNGQLLTSAQAKPKFSLYKKVNDRSKKKRILVAETDHLAYVGTNYDPESLLGGNNGSRYCVGELDKESGTLILHKAELFTLKPYIPGKTEISEDISTEATPMKSNDQKLWIDQVVTTFGSEKQKRAFSAAKKNKVESDVLESALATAVTHAQNEVDKSEAESMSMQNSGLMPPHDPLAEVPQDVYKLEDIISFGAIASLKKAAKVFTKATLSDIDQWRNEKRYPEYVLQHIASLPTSEPQKSLKAAILLCVNCLISMHNMTARAFQREGLHVNLPANVREELVEKFTEKQESKTGKVFCSLSTRMKDKIRLYLFVATLILDEFTVDCLILQQDLKLSCTKVMDHYRALGCTVSKKAIKRKSPQDDDDSPVTTPQATSSCTAVLKIPLNFPKPKREKRSRN